MMGGIRVFVEFTKSSLVSAIILPLEFGFALFPSEPPLTAR
jgi:hypothetical protein